MNHPSPFRIRLVKVFIAICTAISGRRSISQDFLKEQGGIVQWLEQWNHNPYVVGSNPPSVRWLLTIRGFLR